MQGLILIIFDTTESTHVYTNIPTYEV